MPKIKFPMPFEILAHNSIRNIVVTWCVQKEKEVEMSSFTRGGKLGRSEWQMKSSKSKCSTLK